MKTSQLRKNSKWPTGTGKQNLPLFPKFHTQIYKCHSIIVDVSIIIDNRDTCNSLSLNDEICQQRSEGYRYHFPEMCLLFSDFFLQIIIQRRFYRFLSRYLFTGWPLSSHYQIPRLLQTFQVNIYRHILLTTCVNKFKPGFT